MPLYTVRCRLQPLYNASRGANFIEMVHHLHWDDDTAAIDAFPNLVQHWNEDGISSRWLAVRGWPAHELVLYRRSIEDPNSWTPLARQWFTLPEWQELDALEVVIGGIPLAMALVEAPIFAHSRGAVLVREDTAVPNVSRRVYIGPLSPVCAVARFAFIAEVPYTTQIPGPNGDFPFDPESDNVDFWRDNIRDLARNHCADLENYAGDGYSVVPSWKHNQILPVLETRASSVRADIRSRSFRGEMSEPRT